MMSSRLWAAATAAPGIPPMKTPLRPQLDLESCLKAKPIRLRSALFTSSSAWAHLSSISSKLGSHSVMSREVKPIWRHRFQKCVRHIRSRLNRASRRRCSELMDSKNSPSSFDNRLHFVSSDPLSMVQLPKAKDRIDNFADFIFLVRREGLHMRASDRNSFNLTPCGRGKVPASKHSTR